MVRLGPVLFQKKGYMDDDDGLKTVTAVTRGVRATAIAPTVAAVRMLTRELHGDDRAVMVEWWFKMEGGGDMVAIIPGQNQACSHQRILLEEKASCIVAKRLVEEKLRGEEKDSQPLKQSK
ncbi:hypothetical protein L1987_01907 [Smallanthus sonchifolius]|uniref:Uncharacterized protein n=1 Tax=Smallanthus sonchifolius TaxID=185202 RepID=A0ACB9K690_9ASTR|nr:hypothetical protein L1987_01907 [Smallanthus sonchifolius]